MSHSKWLDSAERSGTSWLSVDMIRSATPLHPSIMNRGLKRICSERRRRIQRFHHWQDAQRSLLSELLLRAVASERLTLPPDSITILSPDHQKPVLRDQNRFHFNLSHSGDWVLCASSDSPLGIDVERIRPLDLTLLQSVLSESERRIPQSDDPDRNLRRFYSIWTIKESYAKALGLGLSLPFHNLNVHFPAQSAPFLEDKDPQNGKWTIHFQALDTDHPCSLCSQSSLPPRYRLWSTEDLLNQFNIESSNPSGENSQ